MNNFFYLAKTVFFALIIGLSLQAPNCSIFSSGNVFAQEQNEEAAPLDEKFEQIKTERLKRIRRELVQIQSNIYLAKKKIQTEPDLVTKLRLESELEKLQKELDAKSYLFIETATNLNLQKKDVEVKDTNFSEDLKEIMDPMLDGIKQISERPRAIQALKDKISSLEERLEAADSAKGKLDTFLKENKEKELNRTIKRSIKRVEEVEKSLKIELEDSQFKLLKLDQEEGGLFSNFSYAIFEFFKTKGKNLLLALLVFLGLYWGLGLGQNRFISLFMIRIGRAVDQPGHVHWLKRPLKVFYSLFTFITALFMGVLTLYFLNDWVLVTFIIFLLVGLIWSSRNFFPQYFELFKIVLNFGPVREGERVVFQGIPWKVKSLGYYSRLVNPALSGGTLRIHTRELMSSYSRPVGDTEPWFPTRNDDWVVLSDDTFGKVTMQSPEFVSIKLIGEQLKYIPTTDYLALNPVNLSSGFGIQIVFGVDYEHQEVVLSEVISNFKAHLNERLDQDFSSDSENFHGLTVEFQDAAASSLDVFVLLKCAGCMASRKPVLERRLKSYLVEACNKFGYGIPFQQITVHQAKTEN